MMNLVDDLNRKIQLYDYQSCFDSFLACFRQQDWTLAIGKFGEFSNPGVSDIDAAVVVKNSYLKTAYNLFQKWVSQDKIKAYLFCHPPVILTEELLSYVSYLHTLSSLSWLYNLKQYELKADPDTIDYLNIVWTTYLLPIAISMLKSDEPVSLRLTLLVLKNLHQSYENLTSLIDKRRKRKYISKFIRRKHLHDLGQQNKKELRIKIAKEFEDILLQIFKLLDTYGNTMKGATVMPKYKSVWIKPNLKLERSQFTKISNSRPFVLSINKGVYDLMFAPWHLKQINCEVQKNYCEHVMLARRAFRKEKVPFSFAQPFGYPLYRGKYYLLLRRIYWFLKYTMKL